MIYWDFVLFVFCVLVVEGVFSGFVVLFGDGVRRGCRGLVRMGGVGVVGFLDRGRYRAVGAGDFLGGCVVFGGGVYF